MAKNKFNTSYGIVAKTLDNLVVVLQRKVPYCVQDYFITLQYTTQPPCHFPDIREQFERECLPHLKEYEKWDYQRFMAGDMFEDQYDFPHGQCHPKNTSKYKKFVAAFREFREESGFHFKMSNAHLDTLSMKKLSFMGCDGYHYEQYYFILDNVVGLKRHSYFNSFGNSSTSENKIKSWNDDSLVYDGKLLPIKVAYRKLFEQQTIKKDGKHECLYTAFDPKITTFWEHAKRSFKVQG
ncbi:hypothetical protein JTE90_016267 [Oedothorax gibbosus]|uniref:Nudix hydrolase domain-containing protein n=1 Tax=Oedothorax gibbosus TaxID=931172 RepID=A0AAV6TKB8_9ARAC|nr:hypothetical protein JTE90_016267 [Oedothorax gibbosus]